MQQPLARATVGWKHAYYRHLAFLQTIHQSQKDTSEVIGNHRRSGCSDSHLLGCLCRLQHAVSFSDF